MTRSHGPAGVRAKKKMRLVFIGLGWTWAFSTLLRLIFQRKSVKSKVTGSARRRANAMFIFTSTQALIMNTGKCLLLRVAPLLMIPLLFTIFACSRMANSGSYFKEMFKCSFFFAKVQPFKSEIFASKFCSNTISLVTYIAQHLCLQLQLLPPPGDWPRADKQAFNTTSTA